MPVSVRRNDLLRSRLHKLARLVKGVERGDVDAIHRARVASRRLRELFPILQLDNDVTTKLIRRLKKVTRRLGNVRELDVLLSLAEDLHQSGRDPEGALRRVADTVRQARDAARTRVKTASAADELRRVVGSLRDVARELEGADTGRRSRTWRWAVDLRVARRAAALDRKSVV